MDASSTFSAGCPSAIIRQSGNRAPSDWDSDSSDSIVVQSKMAVSKGVLAGRASTTEPRPVGILESDGGDAGTAAGGVFQETKPEGRKWWNDDADDDGDGNVQPERAKKKKSADAVAFVDGREPNSSAMETPGGGLKRVDVNRHGVANNSLAQSERSNGVAEVDQIDDLTPSEEATHRLPNMPTADDLKRGAKERRRETSADDDHRRLLLQSATASISFRSRRDNKRQKAATKAVDLQLADLNLIEELDKERNASPATVRLQRPSRYVRMIPTGAGSSDERSPTGLKTTVEKAISVNDRPRPALKVVVTDTSDEDDDDTRAVRGSSNNDNHHLSHNDATTVNRRDPAVAEGVVSHRDQKRSNCSSSDDEPPPKDGVVLKFFQVRRKYLLADVPAAVADGTVSRLRINWRQTVAECWREFFAAVGLVVSVPLLFIVELFHFICRDIFYEVICQLVVIFAAYVFKPLVTVVLFNAFAQPIGSLLWNLLHTFRRAVQPLVCLIMDLSYVAADLLQSIRLVEIFKQSSTDLLRRRERQRSTRLTHVV